MEILKAPHPMLRTVCRSDFTIDVATILDMFTTMKLAGGCGLAAPQVGIDAALFITEWGEVFVDPRLDYFAFPYYVVEGCLSLEKKYRVRRYQHIRVNGRFYDTYKAQVIQHELSHLNGTLICDYGEPV
jgi:peptide deformylase